MDIKVPAVGESVYEAVIARWLKKTGDVVAKDEPLCEIETDKITLEVTSEADGVLSITAAEGETVKIGAVIGSIDARGPGAEAKEGAGTVAAGKPAASPEAKPVTAAPMSPSGRKLARELGVEPGDVQGSGRGGRITNADLMKAQGTKAEAEVAEPPPKAPAAPVPPTAPVPSAAPAASPKSATPADLEGRVLRKPMSQIRKRIAERLVSVRQNTAMLTTFNEVDMSEVLKLRKKHGEHFQKRHGVKLGFMSLFVRACCAALQEFPDVNGSIDGGDIVYHNYCDIGIAVGSERGLVVPVLRGAEKLSLAQIEQGIAEFAEKVRGNRIALSDLEGGTFTISNGGIYGSMLSTPILNPPQSGVLGMHNIQERAVVVDGQVVVRPMMYLALSYDHRIVDGKGAVGFLKRVKEYIEDPEEMLLEC
ncbi:2-oxoglutarate dehydrogenase complex dihydrolipoyllysine-residue succinyltransferase [Geomonas subterranea]|uniref:Dihydrolipoyllysine-residue succinyltransferase component of 2-oxoglutarate dehydrogenase complex n=1 Tax=Geomonas subterranea TaxID=2847989 RepID=A0ABX8LG08_9BACT|nr:MULTISPECIES: 2-oxoglutarate dehydrogenase complex dihydrolipoyllysine-residue succinyltransferase [Geomonas]QXE89304.1 2-oxoglutarate dehydrogenase complex dihydrolipoyllysine-residue succinyltransferase [Geomonas subterranea]QXM08583.1 2-oxoglutarate dehydrogenase complex dihydrolipoyllysine-residue succinyltransferase [Geomonas subterranea]